MEASQPPVRARRARGSLSPEQILDAAQEIVEHDGLRQLSMPTLAVRLKSGVASIYWYFKNKDALVDALAQRVMTQIHQQLPPVGDGPWDVELLHYFAAFHSLLREMPAYREVVAYGSGFIRTTDLTPSAQRRLDEGLSLLLRAGLDRPRATEAFGACLSYTRGFAVLQHGEESRGSVTEDRELADLNRLDDQRFQLGLRLMISGIRAELEQSPGAAAHADSAALPPVIKG
ncbi:MAG: putative TetR-family transcriptional regulator [Frankiales bacterium]|nr:putative TetR-family transcriptional regulator [Frankiales bacterium]